jgi:hypothetical protein
VISADYDAPALKTRRHWASFTTAFFVPIESVLHALATSGHVRHLRVRPCPDAVRPIMACVRCAYHAWWYACISLCLSLSLCIKRMIARMTRSAAWPLCERGPFVHVSVCVPMHVSHSLTHSLSQTHTRSLTHSLSYWCDRWHGQTHKDEFERLLRDAPLACPRCQSVFPTMPALKVHLPCTAASIVRAPPTTT